MVSYIPGAVAILRLGTPAVPQAPRNTTWPVDCSRRACRSKVSRAGLTLVAFRRPANTSWSVNVLLRGIFVHAAAHAANYSAPRNRVSARVSPRIDDRVDRVEGSEAEGEKPRKKRSGERGERGERHRCNAARTPTRWTSSRYVGSFDDGTVGAALVTWSEYNRVNCNRFRGSAPTRNTRDEW